MRRYYPALLAALALVLLGANATTEARPSCPTVTPRPSATVPAPTAIATPPASFAATPAPTAMPTATAAPIAVLDKDFSDGQLSPFKKLTYPDQHPGDNMEVYNRFANGKPVVANGYLYLPATKRADGLWDATLVGTSQDGNGPTFGYGRFEFTMRANVGRATWQSGWLYDTTTWSSTEIDWPEMLESQRISAHVVGFGGWYGSPPADWATVWHTFYIERRADHVSFGWDGTEKYRVNGAMPAKPLAILLDSKLGFPWAEGPDATTPNPTWLEVSRVRVLP